MTDFDDYLDAHEHLAQLAIEGNDREAPPEYFEEIIDKADAPALVLQLAIALAEERALWGDVPAPGAGRDAGADGDE